MPIQSPAIDEFLTELELISASKRLTEPYEEAYHWISGSGIRLHPNETVCTIAFAINGEMMVKHLTWREVVSLHDAYDRIQELEREISAYAGV